VTSKSFGLFRRLFTGAWGREFRAIVHAAPGENVADFRWNAATTHLRYRAGRLRLAATFSLLLIFSTILAGLGAVASLQQLDTWALRLRSEPIAAAVSAAATDLTSWQTATEHQRVMLSFNPTDVQEIAKLSDLQKHQSELSQRHRRLQDIQVEMLTSHGLANVIPGVLARVAILGATMFLTQILLAVYRYNSRLATYVEGRANALQIFHEIGGSLPLDSAIALFAGDGVGFGKQPATPLEQTVDVLRTALEGARDIAKTVKP
jgi:hypothetical protein